MTDFIIYMKYGVHAGHSVNMILERKRSDLERFGWFLWGYCSTICDPIKQVQPLAREAKLHNASVYLAMSPTPSALYNEGWKAAEFSKDQVKWEQPPDGMDVYGSPKAIVCADFVECNMPLSLDDYEVSLGNSKGRRLSSYISGRVDKGCASRVKTNASSSSQNNLVAIKLLFKVVDPYAVYLR